MIDKKQSSINFLKSKLITRQNTHIIHGEEVIFISLKKLNKLFEESKEMHENEIINAWSESYSKVLDAFDKKDSGFSSLKEFEDYYNQTYGND